MTSVLLSRLREACARFRLAWRKRAPEEVLDVFR